MSMIIIKYITEQDMNQIIQEQTSKGLLLVQVSNVTEGNFLGFSDSPNPQKTPLELQVDELKTDAQTLDDRTVGMQAIDDFTLQAQATIDERTVGMQEIDDFTLLQVTDLQQQVDQLKADVAALKGGV